MPPIAPLTEGMTPRLMAHIRIPTLLDTVSAYMNLEQRGSLNWRCREQGLRHLHAC